jgi:diadenylate cyclase
VAYLLITPSLPKLTVTAVIDILLVAFLIYELLMIVRGTRAAHILAGILTLVFIYRLSIWGELELLRSILSNIMPYMAIAVIILFQSEIRRTLAQLGRQRWFNRGFRRRDSTDEILLALNRMSQERMGALIVLERDIGLRTFIESGVRLDANLSRDLLLAIFHPGGALHDGAVIIRKDRISASACFLPLSMNPALSTKLGTRHRAGIGITEETDCLSIIVSEETGRLSVAVFGDIQQDLTVSQVDEKIKRHFGIGKRSTKFQAGTVTAPVETKETAPLHKVSRQ